MTVSQFSAQIKTRMGSWRKNVTDSWSERRDDGRAERESGGCRESIMRVKVGGQRVGTLLTLL